MPLKPSAIDEQEGAAGGEVRPEHEVVDEELRASSEEICQRGAPLVGLEVVPLVDLHPGQFLPLARQIVAAPREFLLRLEQLEPRCEPFFTCPRSRASSLFPSLGVLRRSYRSRYDELIDGREID